MDLKPYQVGDNDIVLAECEKSAIQLLADYGDLTLSDMSLDDVEDLSTRLDLRFQDEEGNDIGTLGAWIKDMTAPQYLVGWE